MPTPFHLAIPVADVERSRDFYTQMLGCAVGRSAERWIDLNLFGHQLVCHQVDSTEPEVKNHNPVDGHDVPVPHFGVVLTMEDWRSLADRLIRLNVKFVIEPHIRFEGVPGEQGTLFLLDPDGNALEFKGFEDIDSQLFDPGI